MQRTFRIMVQEPGQDVQVVEEGMIARHSNRSLIDGVEVDDTAVERMGVIHFLFQRLGPLICDLVWHIVHGMYCAWDGEK